MAMTILWRGLLLLATCRGAAAQGFPTKLIRIIVTSPPGSGGDIVLRTIAQALSERYPQQVVVENRAGAGGPIGQQAIFQASADGYTIGLASTAHVVAPMLQSKQPFRPIEAFTPIIKVGEITKSYGKLIDEIGLKRRLAGTTCG